jgi:hypothetical protein
VGSTCVPDIELYNARGSFLAAGVSFDASNELEIVRVDMPSGLYYIRVSYGSASVAPGNYEVRVDTP